MCEIAVVDPEQADATVIHQIAAKFEDEQGDGLGVLAIKNNEDSFEYETYKSVYPHWQTLFAFTQRHMEDTWRFVIHGRASTCGAVNREAAHPITVDCDECDFDHVIHNGSVRNHRNIRGGLTSAGHDFNTKVDSEVLAHKVSDLPETVEDHDRQTYSFRGNLNYLLFSEDGIFVRVSNKYHLTDEFTMTCSLRFFDDYEDYGFDRGSKTEWMLISPGDEPDIETKERTSNYTISSGTNSRRGARHNSRAAEGLWGSYEDESQGDLTTYTKEYIDHCDEYDSIHALKIAPGVMEVIDTAQDESTHIFRDVNPRLYYWYAPEEPPENVTIERLEELAEDNEVPAGQTNITEFNDENIDAVKKEAATAAAKAVKESTGNVNIEEAAEISEDVYEMMQSGDNAIQGTIGE